ncbi:hypothetical protein WN51_14250 [Melipona quadrifasciata]|uniref:RIIa domain-containing protein n=1 Tax=Melipona quadrifasciata TaxID=166423 RepID=A0A0M9A2U5_9HYME|nr:hypothetical protein WN51_14250 [Melipona quadrifasciata]
MSEMDYIIVPRVPRGLAPAVEGLAREILRQRPRNIYAFAAEHFAELVKLRDKERTGEVVSKILQHKLVKKSDSVVDWAKLNSGNKNDVDVAESRNDHFHNFHKYDNSISEEAMARREAKKSTTWKIATRKAAPAASKRKGEERTSSKSGWSISRTVKALKQRHEYRATSSDIEQKYEGDCNKGLNGKETEKVVADYADHPDHPDHRSPRFSNKDPFVRSSSAGNITYAKRVKSREVGEDLEKFYTVAALDEKSYRNEKNLTRQKSADQIERTCMYFKDVCTNEDAGILDAGTTSDRKRSRSLVNNEGRNESNVRQKTRRQHATDGRMARNLKDEWRSAMEDQRKEQETFREEFGDAKEDDAKLNLQLEKRNEKASNEMGEILINVESRLDLLKSNTTFDDSTNETSNVSGTTVSVVLPLVVGRQSSGKCTRNNVRERCEYESNGGEDGAGNFILPPISNDGSKSTRKGSNLIELPSLSNDADARSNEQATHHRHHCEDSTSSTRIQKRSESEKELFKLEGVAANSDYSRKAIEKGNCRGQDSRGDVNVHDIVSRKYPRESKSVEGSKVLLTTGNAIEQDIDETEIPQQSGIIQRPCSSSSEEEAGGIRETWKDSLSVTPDSIENLSEKTNSMSKRLESERKNGEEGVEENRDEVGNERGERCPGPNELERKLIEIETMEKSIENTLVSSRSTISNDFDNEFGESERSIEFPRRNFEPDCARNEQEVASRAEDEWTKKNSDKSEKKSATSNDESDEDNDDNIEIGSTGNETSIRKRSNFDSDNSETLVNEDNNDDSDDSTNVRETERFSQLSTSTRGVDVSCHVLTEGSPCEIPETVTTVIIPDKIVDNGGNNVCKIELDDSTALDQFEIPSTGNSEIETNKEEQRGEEHCQDQNLFGEYTGPETIVRYSSSVDAHFLRDVKDAADRVSAHQEDLANIKEEEENEDDQFPKVPQRGGIVDRLHRGRIVDTLEKSAETSAKLRKSIECRAKLTSSSRDQRLETSKVDSKEETSPYALSNISGPSSKHDYADAERIAKTDNSTKKNREEEERKTFLDDRSSDVSLSFEQVGPTINVPELNLDSLQDVTISSTIGESDSKNRLSNENGNVISSEDENISLSSFDALASSDNERKPNEPNDETLSFGNDRASEPVTKVAGSETEVCCLKFQRAEEFSNDDENEEESRYVEEEIARELIRNFIIDNTKQVVESNGSTTSSSPKPQANNTKSNQAEDFDETKMAFSEKEGKKEEIARSFSRHTGEFHDSLPLPLIETSKYMLVHASKPALRTADDCLTFPANLYSEIQECTGTFNVPSLRQAYRKLSPTVVDIFENFHLLVDASNWNQSSSNTSPCIIRVGHASDQVHTTDKAGSIPIFETSLSPNSDPDDHREPLALDNTLQPIVIEEISNIDQGEEQTLSLHKADANFPRKIIGLCSPPKQLSLCHSDNVEDKDEETTCCASTSVRETTNQLIDNDNLPTDISSGSATPVRDNVEKDDVEREETNE